MTDEVEAMSDATGAPSVESTSRSSTPWIPESPSVTPSEFRAAPDMDADVYPLTRTGAFELFIDDNEGKGHTSDTNDRAVTVGGCVVAGSGAMIVGGTFGLDWLWDLTDGSGAFLLGIPLFTVITVACMFLGGLPGHLMGKSSKRKQSRREDTELRIGNHAPIGALYNRVAENQTGPHDVLWELWEDLTETAEEAAVQWDTAGPRQRQVYNDHIAEVAGRIERQVSDRTAQQVDTGAIAAELQAPDSQADAEQAALLQRRLADKTRLWDGIVAEPAGQSGATDEGFPDPQLKGHHHDYR